MSTVCGRPQGGGGSAHVDACGQGGQKRDFCGRHKWMAPKGEYTPASLAAFDITTLSSSALPVTFSLKFSDCSITVVVPPLWNKLPPVLRQLSDPSCEFTKTAPFAISSQLLHSKLIALLFNKTYRDSSSSPTSLPLSAPNTSTIQTHFSIYRMSRIVGQSKDNIGRA